MPRYKLTVEYNGTPTVGWQKQLERSSGGVARLSVQGALEDAVFAMSGEHAEVVGAGRTDAGVHALAQVAHVDLQKDWDLYKLMQGMNQHMRDQIVYEPCPVSVINAEKAADDFHARFSALRRHYTYLILNRAARPALDATRVWHVPEQLDVEAMQHAANHLLGHHDFTSFRDTQCQSKSPEKTIDFIQLTRQNDVVAMNIHARSFLHHMVRNIMGTLWMVGTGRIDADDILKILAAKNRAEAGPTAPAHGLYLTQVDY